MIWLTPEKLKDIGVTTAMLRHNRDKWRFRETSARGRNGKAIRETLLESLPERFQQVYLRRHYREIEMENHPVTEAVTPLLRKEGSSLTTELSSAAELLPADDDATDVLGADGERRLT